MFLRSQNTSMYVRVCSFPKNEVKLMGYIIPRIIHGVYCLKCIAPMLRKGLSTDWKIGVPDSEYIQKFPKHFNTLTY